MVDESKAWNDLSGRYVVKAINHQLAYSMDALARTARRAIPLLLTQNPSGVIENDGILAGWTGEQQHLQSDRRKVRS